LLLSPALPSGPGGVLWLGSCLGADGGSDGAENLESTCETVVLLGFGGVPAGGASSWMVSPTWLEEFESREWVLYCAALGPETCREG